MWITQKKSPRLFTAAAAVACLFLGAYILHGDDVAVKVLSSECRNYICRVDVEIANHTNDYLACNLSVRGLRKTGKASNDTTPGFAGETMIPLKLHPKEKRRMTIEVTMRARHSTIQAHAWDLRRID